MVSLKPIIMLALSVVVVMSMSALDPVTEKLLTGLESSEVSLFTTTSFDVYHMETDKYKPGYLTYIDRRALKTSDGNITETIAGDSAKSGYKEGVGEDARFSTFYGFTQISPTRAIVSDNSNHCLRQVNRISRLTSVFAGQCQSNGYRDGASARFSRPQTLIVDKKNSKQLLVADSSNRAVRTVDVESKRVGTFIKSHRLVSMRDLVQDKITGDIYITSSRSLYKLSYNTKSLNMISYGITGHFNGKQPSSLWGLFMIEAVIIVPDVHNHRILKYNTNIASWSSLNACDVTKSHNSTDDCVINFPISILLTSSRLLIGSYKKITSYKPLTEGSTTPEILTTPVMPVCEHKNITVYTDSHAGTARVELGEGDTINLSEGTHTYETPGPYNQTCVTTVNVVSHKTDLQRKTLNCPEKQVALTSPENGLATFQLQFGDQEITLKLPFGQYQHVIKMSDKTCNVTMNAEDYRVRRTLELVADYSVDCSELTSTVTRSLLEDVAQQSYAIVEALCGSVCKKPGDHAQPVLSCDGVSGLKIRWPTDLKYTADVASVPAYIRQTLEKRIRARGATMNVVVFGSTPPIVYPRKAANGGYVDISLSTTCINGLLYSDIQKKCV